MSKEKPKVLVLTGDGINAEQETAEAFRLAGFDPSIRHINDLIAEKTNLDGLSKSYQVLALPGGSSFGDDLGGGKLLALKIKYGLGWDLREYAQRGGLVLGVCNGFQALIKLGVFGKSVSIAMNRQGQFMNRWVRVKVGTAQSVWLSGMEELDLPIRHGEGRILFEKKERPSEGSALPCLHYSEDVNGSADRVAGLTDESGRILGLMPHPEAFLRWTAHPEWTAEPSSARGTGRMLFENAYRAV